MNIHKRKGGVLGLVPGIILIIACVGLALYSLAEFFGGSKQLLNGTDSGALAAARQLLTVGLSQTEVKNLPIEFQSLGVDGTGVPTGVDPNNGAVNLNNAIFNIYAFNRAAGYTLLVALNAAEDGSQAAINNANALITDLNKFGTELNNNLANAPQLAATFTTLADNNNTNMLGSQSAISLGNNGQLQYACVPGNGTGKANIYFNAGTYSNDSTLKGWIVQITANSSAKSQINNRYNQSDPGAQAGQSFVPGYQPLDISAITGVAGFSTQIFASSVNPSQMPHMIDSGRFNQAGTAKNCYAPANSVSAQGNATSTVGGANLLCNALACATLGAYDNQYPITLPYGWIRIHNLPDAITANAAQSSALSPVPLWINFPNSIFNTELWSGAGGLYGIYVTNNAVFCTEGYSNPNDPFDYGPPAYSGKQELLAWINYTTTPCNNANDLDKYGHDMTLDPSRQQADGSYILGYASPSPNMRYSANYEQLATVDQMHAVNAILAYCNSTMYDENPPSECTGQNLSTFISNYHDGIYDNAGPLDTGTQPTGGLTGLEYLKGEVIGELLKVYLSTMTNDEFTHFAFNLTVPQAPAGSKIYSRSNNTGYAVPTNERSVAFGTIGTPADLLNQLSSYGATDVNLQDNAQWTNSGSPLGKLLQRCQQILPAATAQDIISLLSANPIDLNEYQYIYLPVGGTKLAISKLPPLFLQQYTEYTNPGSIIPDSTAVITCADQVWDDSGDWSYLNNYQRIPLGICDNVVDAAIGVSGNIEGDGSTHQQPFTSFSGNLSTYDAVTWTSNSGRNNFLGELTFGNYVSGSYGSFAQPN